MTLGPPLTAIVRRLCRTTKHTPSAPLSRTFTITCRGNPIPHDDLFTYTNGRFLANEKHACDRRYVAFDIDRLCAIAASTGPHPHSAVHAIEKMEGGFSKALLLRKEDGSEVIAKIPFRIAGPPKYTTAAEIGVLKYSAYTKVPVPRVLAWSCDEANPVGVEYIIMEKAPGTQLFERWDQVSEMDKLGVVQQLVRFEGEMAGIRLPASGSLYLRESMSEEDGDAYIPLDHDADPYGLFCIGPSCERSWYAREGEATSLQHSHFKRGPWRNLSSFGIALVDRETARVQQTPPTLASDLPRGSPSEHLAVLNMTKDVMAMLDTPSLLVSNLSEPVLWHTDLHMANIFVSPTNPPTIASLIDWQSVTAAPLFLQARFPEFLPVGEEYTLGTTALPQRPQHLHEMDAQDREYTEYTFTQAKLAKAYELTSGYENNQAYKALRTPAFLRDLFTHCGAVSEDGIVPLQTCLIELSALWHDLGFTVPCPIHFSEAELQRHGRRDEVHRNVHRVRELAGKMLGADGEGWIAPQMDVAAKRVRNRELMREVMGRSGEFGLEPDAVRRIWPYREVEEVEGSKQ